MPISARVLSEHRSPFQTTISITHPSTNPNQPKQLRLDSDLRVLAVTKYALVLFGSAHWFGCIWWAVARFSGFVETCWVVQYYRLIGKAVDDETFRSSSYNYLLSLYWGFTVLTGEVMQGYAPDNTQETILCVASTFCQVLVFSFLLGILLHYVRAYAARPAGLGWGTCVCLCVFVCLGGCGSG
jgi:hypothetical protein